MDTNAHVSPPTELIDQVQQAFKEQFSGTPRLFCAPGRINIIGEHTDYSEGLVMPAAIDRFCIVAIHPNGTDTLRVRSLNHGEASLPPGFQRRGDWTDYIAGVRAALLDAGVETPGCDLVIGGDVPEGAGVSSSAALEVSTAASLLTTVEHSAPPLQMARWCQRAENDYVDMPCGIMDQYISAQGVAGHALRIDCRTLSHTTVSLPSSLAFLVVDSMVRHRLVDGGYAARRADCETAAQALGVSALRDADMDMIAASELGERVRRRAQHVVAENARVLETSRALEQNDARKAGQLMDQSHDSLRTLFEATCTETDALVQICRRVDGVYGARQMGGGFGGAVLVLVDADAARDASAAIIQGYQATTGARTTSFICKIAGGVREICD